jgi:predicted phosphodiesterase
MTVPAEYQQLQNEDYVDWKARLLSLKCNKQTDLDWIEIRDVLGETCHPDSLRKAAVGFLEAYNYFKGKSEDSLSDIALDEIRKKELSLDAKRKMLSSEKSEINKWLTQIGRSEIWYEKILESISNQKGIKVPNYKIEKYPSPSDAVLGIADAHYGKQVTILGLDDEVLNEYNVEVFERRMWELLNKTIEKMNKENQRHLSIFDLSDSIDGILRMSQLQAIQLGITDSVIGYSNFLATWLNELSHYLSIDYYACMGNHNEIRPLGSKKGEFAHENTQRIINWYLEGVLKDNPNITIHKSKELQYVDVAGTKILATHGQYETNPERAINEYMSIYKKPIDILFTAHLHNFSQKSVGMNGIIDIEHIRAASLCGIDEYSLTLKKTANAGAKLMFFTEGYGRDATYDIRLN